MLIMGSVSVASSRAGYYYDIDARNGGGADGDFEHEPYLWPVLDHKLLTNSTPTPALTHATPR